MTVDRQLYDLIRTAVRDELRESAVPRAAATEPDMVKLGDVRKWVDVSKSTLKAWIKANRLPAYGKGRLLRVKLDDVRACLKRSSPALAVAPGDQAGAIVASLPRRRNG